MILSKKTLPVLISTLLATASSYALKAPTPLNCMNINVENGSVWSSTTPWTAGSISVKNNCGKDIDLRNAQLKLVGTTSYESAHISSAPAGLAWPAYSVSTSDSNANKVTTFIFNKFDKGNEWWTPNTNMAPGAELTFSLNPIQGASFKSSAFYPNGEAPITDKGSISFNTADGSDTIPSGTKITITGKDTGFSTEVDFSNGLNVKDIPYGEYNVSANATIDGKSVEISLIPATLTLSKDSSSVSVLASYKKQTAQLIIQFSKSKPVDVSQNTVAVNIVNDSTNSTTIKDIKWNDLAKLELQKNIDYKISASPVVGTQFQYNFNFDGQSISNINISGNQKTVQMSYTQESIPTGIARITASNLDGNKVDVHFTGEDKVTHTVNLSDTGSPYDFTLPSGQSYAVTANTFTANNYKYSLNQSPTINITNNQTTQVSLAFDKQKIDPVTGKVLSIFWCGFSGSYCGQSTTDDVYSKATHVILAFVNTHTDGSVIADTMPTQMINDWHRAGKKVIISVGGQNGHWGPIFANPDNFVKSIVKIITDNNLDGVDLDIEGYTTAPEVVSETISKLRSALGADKQIIVSPENVTVYPQAGIPVPSPGQGGSPWNYFVPILNASLSKIDYVQPQMYNNGYLGVPVATAAFLETNYLGWMNKYPNYTIPNFNGVPANKLIMGVLASTSAGIASFYAPPTALKAAISSLKKQGIDVGGVMMWDSHWDTLNSNAISKAASEALNL